LPAVSRFVILEHDHPHLHWDLMLECGAALRTWRLGSPPGRGGPVDAVALSDHRLAYLDYEGPVSGNRGRVVRWDGGTFAWQSDDGGRLVVRLNGSRLRGVLVVEMVGGDASRVTFTPEES
jgi:hypothetical protein